MTRFHGPHARSLARRTGEGCAALLISLAAGLSGCGSDGGGGSDPDPEGSIVGTITSDERGALGGVTVTATPGGATGTSQPTTGAYSISPLGFGAYTLALSDLPAGCTDPGTRGVNVNSTNPLTESFNLACEPVTGIQGNVRAREYGRPLVNVTVTANPGGHVTSTDQVTGAYAFPTLPAGTYDLTVTDGLPRECVTPAAVQATVTPTAGAVTNITASCQRLYVSDLADAIHIFPAVANGFDGELEVAFIWGPLTSLSTPAGLRLDATGRLFVGNVGSSRLNSYPRGASGNAALRWSNGLGQVFGVAVDGQDRVYTASYDRAEVAVLEPEQGAVVRLIRGAATTLANPHAVAVDASGRVYVGDNDRILVFAAGAQDDAAPVATIAGPLTGLRTIYAMALDGAGRVYVTNYDDSSVTAYSVNATGNVAPVISIRGNATGIVSPTGLAIGRDGKVFVADYANAAVRAFAPNVTGNVAPVATIGGIRLTGPTGLALDP